MQVYVVGLLFDPTKTHVVLIRKNRGPDVVVGRLNGLGGKVEPGESPAQAMAREFQEECGIKISPAMWTKFCITRGEDHEIHFYWATDSRWLEARTQESEEIEILNILEIRTETDLVHNIRWMVEYLRDPLYVLHDIIELKSPVTIRNINP